MNKAAQAYFKTKVSTTDQGQLLLMLYDGALNYLQQARDKMLAKDYAAKGLLISKAIDIVNELSNSLNMEKGGSLAENLNNLYFLCTARLLQANLKMNVEQLDSVTKILSGLRQAYAQILDSPEAQKAAAQIASQLKPEASLMQRSAVQTAPTTTIPLNIGQMQARAAYGQHAAAAQSVPQPTAQPKATVTAMPHPVTSASAVTAMQSASNGDTTGVTPHVPSMPTMAPHAGAYQKLGAYKTL